MKRPTLALATVAAAIALTGTAHAQSAPDAGALRQQIERQQVLPMPPQAAPSVTPAPEPLSNFSSATVTLQSVRFVGNTLLTADQLGLVVQHYLHQPQTFSQLQQAALEITNAYRDAGRLARAYLPKQDLSNGELTIQIIEAVFSGVTLDGADSARVQFSKIERIFQSQQDGQLHVNMAALDRALLLADDLPGVAVAGSLVAGQQDGETGLRIKLVDEPLVTGDAGLDNAGSRSTGGERLSSNLRLNSPLGLGDLFGISAAHTQGSDYLLLSAAMPAGSAGWRVGGNASKLTYRIISPEFSALNSQGNSDSVGLEASYPLIRARTRNLYLSVALDQKSFHNESNAAVQSDYSSRSSSIGLSGNAFDNFGGGGANSASLTLVEGSTELGLLDVSENAALGGSFSKLRYALTRQQAIAPDTSVYAALSGQYSNQALDSSEKFTLGGSNGVRAYPSGEGSGSSGQLLNLELRWRMPQGMVLTGFYDWGSLSNLDTSPRYSLQGAGVGVSWQAGRDVSFKAIWAHRIGDNPNPTDTGNDQDGSLNASRWWLSASVAF